MLHENVIILFNVKKDYSGKFKIYYRRHFNYVYRPYEKVTRNSEPLLLNRQLHPLYSKKEALSSN